MSHQFIQGDSRRLPLADQSVHAVITSPPYYSLREYTKSEHEIGRTAFGGLAQYVLDLGDIFAECRRVLRDDGCLILNIGDTYMQKQLMGVPWMVARHLQSKEWLLRSDSIWFKPNGFPDSAADRPEASHEYLFVFSKTNRNYWDKHAVERPDRLSVRRVPVGRSKHAHFASYPPQLVKPYILQATSGAGVCPECGAPWLREIIKERVPTRPGRDCKADATGKAKRDPRRHVTHVSTLGWRPGCSCDRLLQGLYTELELSSLIAPITVPATVLDPFAGACSTAVACEWSGRSSVSVDLGGEYLEIGKNRVAREHPPRRRKAKNGWPPLPGQMTLPFFLTEI